MLVSSRMKFDIQAVHPITHSHARREPYTFFAQKVLKKKQTNFNHDYSGEKQLSIKSSFRKIRGKKIKSKEEKHISVRTEIYAQRILVLLYYWESRIRTQVMRSQLWRNGRLTENRIKCRHVVEFWTCSSAQRNFTGNDKCEKKDDKCLI